MDQILFLILRTNLALPPQSRCAAQVGEEGCEGVLLKSFYFFADFVVVQVSSILKRAVFLSRNNSIKCEVAPETFPRLIWRSPKRCGETMKYYPAMILRRTSAGDSDLSSILQFS